MGVLSLLFRVIMFLFRTLQSWLNPVREEPHPQPQQTDHESFSSSSSSSSRSCYNCEEDEASSSSIPPSRYDVFLSLRGLDTRNTFTGHLYNRLDQVGIATFMDEKELKEGEEIRPNLLKAIEDSRISITIFSLNYASSKWCLDELVHIMECRERSKQQLVLPVFFHVDPRDVRNQKGRFGEEFEKLAAKTDDGEKVKRWKKALKKTGELKGWHLENGHEAKLIKEIVGRVSRELENITLPQAKNLVGIEPSVEDMKRLLNVESKGVRIVGICGMGGIGKTTLAHTVFNQILCNFEGHIFLEDIRQVSKNPGGVVSLQKQLISKILDQEAQSITDVDSGKNFISSRLQRKKVIVVLDDVENITQLEALAGRSDWFGTGSRIIITTRDEHVLNSYEDYEIYKLKDLDFDHSFQLFCNYAFRGSHPQKDLMNLAWNVVHTTGGLPLAIKVLGSFLCGKHSLEEWKTTLEKLKKNQHNDIMQTLKISYDGLDRNEREIFLDIACFFIGHDEEEATYIWESCEFFPKIEIRNLRQKCLIDVDTENKFRMHDQLRDMARQIVLEEQPTEPGERSRLWSHEEVLDVLKESTGTKKVRGLLLKLEWPANASEESRFKTKAFLAMSSLKLLQIDNAILEGGFENLSSELRWLCRKGCPLESLPTDFHLEKLVVLDLSYSKITQVWNGRHQNQTLANVKVLKLRNCPNLTKTTDFSRLPNLVVLNLEGCSNLTALPGSICKLKSLRTLILSSCSILKKLPRDLGDMESLTVFLADKTAIEYLPESIGDLKRLKWLRLTGCESLRGLPDSFGRIKSSIKLELEVLELADCKLLHRLPVSIGFAQNLTTLTLAGTSITELSSDIVLLEKLETLSVTGCKKLKSLPKLPLSLIKLFANDCSSMDRLPDLSNLTNMKKIDLSHCKKLQSLPELPSSLIELFAYGCSSMERLPDRSNLTNLIGLQCSGTSIRELPNGIALLEKLEVLRVSDCRKRVKLSDAIGRLSSLWSLNASNCNLWKGGIPTAIGKLSLLRDLEFGGNNFYSLPATISHLSHLEVFTVRNYRNLKSLPELPPSCLRYIFASDCPSLEILPDLSNLKSLKSLHMHGCISVESLPEFSNFNEMYDLELGNCEKLVDIQGIEKMGSWMYLNLSGTSKIPADTLRKCILHPDNQLPFEEILLSFPGNKIPDWFTPLEIRKSWSGERIRMVKPSRHSNGEQHHQKKMKILLCIVFFNPDEERTKLEISVEQLKYRLDSRIYIEKTNGDQICLLRFKPGQFEETDEISIVLKPPEWGGKVSPIVKKAGMHVLYYENEEEEESDDNYTTTVQSAYERIADFFFPLNDNDDGGDRESNSSSSHRKRNNSHLLSDAREGGYFFPGKSKPQKKKE